MFFILIPVILAQYDSYYDSDGDLIPFEDLVPTQLVTTFDPPPSEEIEDVKEDHHESKFRILR